MYNPNVLFINEKYIKYNLDSIKSYIGENTNIMPIIKANAYGIGVENILKVIEDKNITQVGVATVEEAVYIRKKYNGMILVLLQPFKEQIIDIITNNIAVNVSDFNFLIELNNMAKSKETIANVHLEVNTGMGRTGIQMNEIEEFIKKVKWLKHVNIEGISTHYSTAKDDVYTKEQIQKFNYAINKIKENINSIKYIHACSSSSVLSYPEAYFDLVIDASASDVSMAYQLDIDDTALADHPNIYFSVTNLDNNLTTTTNSYNGLIRLSDTNKVHNIRINLVWANQQQYDEDDTDLIDGELEFPITANFIQSIAE